MLRLYIALLDVHEPAARAALTDRPAPDGLAGYVADRVMPAVVAATVAAGPPALAGAVRGDPGPRAAAVAAWLAGERQPAVAEYLARAASAPVLESLGDAGALPRPRREGGCPRCGGPPQLSYLAESGELLLTAPRQLMCARCGGFWVHERLSCAGCGERSSAAR